MTYPRPGLFSKRPNRKCIPIFIPSIVISKYDEKDYILSFLHLRGEARLSSVQFSCLFIFHHLHRKSRDSIFQVKTPIQPPQVESIKIPKLYLKYF
ncbi:hypothetical protein E1A91_A10G174300v1 [Gossypium mustelinum]|uniref:Uncharacterized protein n=1 Tax=Gossypium mustelinum TaxID=34275 RepID=A0A5D2XMX6_GOSMU|nr:hypothetical protein E1A91_A10G174300v1 [Gossypium mustelinum]